MADGTSDAVDTATLEGPAASWLAERADELGVSTEAFLEQVVAAYRAVEEADEGTDVVTGDELEDRLAGVESEFERRLEDVDSEFDEKIEDVRERVIQVKRDADAKASADHDHPELADSAADALDAAREAEERADALAADVRDLEERLDAGFDNFEEVLSYLRDETDDIDRKATTLATAVVAMRDSVASLSAAAARRERVERLRREANRAGVREADCADCGESVTVALLTEPNCPFCGAAFDGVEANPGWFGSHVLETGEKPALTGEDAWDGDEEPWLDADVETLEEMAGDGDADADVDDLGIGERETGGATGADGASAQSDGGRSASDRARSETDEAPPASSGASPEPGDGEHSERDGGETDG